MKPFNLEEAKAGKPVVTRDGKSVRILCFDRKTDAYSGPYSDGYSIVGLVQVREKEVEGEFILSWTKEGKCSCTSIESVNANDLFMKSEKRAGWINIYKYNQHPSERRVDDFYTSEDAAKAAKASNNGVYNYLATVYIEWEE